MLEGLNGELELFKSPSFLLSSIHLLPTNLILPSSVTAIADKLGIDFALVHRKRKGNSLSAPESMEILVGDVKDKVCLGACVFKLLHLYLALGGYFGRRYDRHRLNFDPCCSHTP